MAAFKAHCALRFWRQSEVVGPSKTPEGTKKEGLGQFGKITRLADLPPDDVLTDYVKKAAALNQSGTKPVRAPAPAARKELVVPGFFMDALRKNKKALATFAAYPPSHKKEYVQWVVEAKREETRAKRLAATMVRLAQGKTRHAEYQTR
jgi:uncharacterized protein YdeI (YjbR/CyaY-like superfamily)